MERTKQVADWKLDLLADIQCAEQQAVNGPFYPERGITRETLLAYAQDCRNQLGNPEESLGHALRGSF